MIDSSGSSGEEGKQAPPGSLKMSESTSALRHRVPPIIKYSSDSDSDSDSEDCLGDEELEQKRKCHQRIPVAVKNAGKLPFDIDGDVQFRLPYDPQHRMKSSRDGRPWKTWVTTSRKGYSSL